jgi:hypothetical protein
MSLITPTFADKVNEGTAPQQQGNGSDKPTIVVQHEPITGSLGWMPPLSPFPTGVTTVRPAPEPQPLKVACIGTAPSSRMLAPFADPSWQIWACSPGNQGVFPRVDVWFELHCNLLWPDYKHYGEPYIKWLSEQKFPVYMQDQSFLSNALTFPAEELKKEFGVYHFTSTFAWMMAFAIYKGAKEVALYGIDMASHEEYLAQRAGAYHFFEEGAKRGCRVWAPFESDIMQPPALYGYSDKAPLGRKILARKSELKGRRAAVQQQIAQLEAQIAAHRRDDVYLAGAEEDTSYYVDIHLGAQDNSVDVGAGYLNKLLQGAKQP